jgi:hypothetical protein
MKKFAFFAIVAALLCLATPGYPGYLKLGGTMYAGTDGYLVSGKQVTINWFSKDIDLQTKVKLTLLKNGAPFRVIATGLALTNGYKDILNQWCNDTKWAPANSDIGCNYKLLLSTEDNTISDTSQTFGIFPAKNFVSQGKYSYVRLDSPHGGEVLRLGQSYQIKWTFLPIINQWPSQKLKLELFYNQNKVADIATVNLDFNQCPIYGSLNWTVGSNLTPGNTYQIKISGDTSSWLSGNFILAYPGSKPGTGSKFHQVDKSKVGTD